MSSHIHRVKKTAKGLATKTQRGGVWYFGYLLGGVAWPRVAYRFGWGPTAPAIIQAAFAAAGELAGSPVDPDDLQRLGLAAKEQRQAVANVPADEIERLMDRAHSAGITKVSSSFDTLARTPEGALVFADLSNIRKHRPGTLHFLAARDVDRRLFNHRFGASRLTEASARAALEEMKARVPAGQDDYAAIDFGCGLTLGPVASTAGSTPQWDSFNRHIVAPLVAGKRVLDLGCHNGALALMMGRAGARQVVAVELDPAFADAARMNARILSWRDVRAYDIQVLTGDMRLFLTADLGSFDVVTAFCSLYHTPEEDMARIVTKAASMNAVLILQADESIDHLPSKTLDLHRIMRENGYPEIQVHTPAGFAHPLLVGYTQRGGGHVTATSPGVSCRKACNRLTVLSVQYSSSSAYLI